MTRLPRQQQVPIVIRGVNLVALALLGFLLIPTAVVRLEQLIVVLPALLLLICAYWVFQNNPIVSAIYFALSLSLVLWIVICENIVLVDNALGSHITGQLELGMRLKSFAKNNLKHQNQFRQECCGDPLSYNYKPGSVYRLIYDCPQCNQPYETNVDQTGYLNGQYGLIDNGRPVDIFMAGDSVLQGYGTLSIVKFLNELLPARVWNLSSTRYGPRQKAHALMTYALPRLPKWIIIEFYSGNDVNDAVIDESCEGTGTYHCLFNLPERKRRLLAHPIFGPMVDASKDIPPIFERYTEDNFTLAVTQYLISNIKGAIKANMWNSPPIPDAPRQGDDGQARKRFAVVEVSYPGGNADFEVRREKKIEWIKEGMQLTYRRYDLLAGEIDKMQQPPGMILLYNPSAYEIYRDSVVDRDEKTDRVSQFQRQALSDYAGKHGWTFLDLTAALAEEVTRSGVWLYGEYDRTHWSTQGTVAVASVLGRELVKLIGRPNTTPLHAASAKHQVIEVGGR